jgi:hypothetical protein
VKHHLGMLKRDARLKPSNDIRLTGTIPTVPSCSGRMLIPLRVT